MIKISELTPKDAPLSTTDLLEISEETPDGFVSKSVTGIDIQQSVGKYGTQFGINTETPTHSLQVESDEQCIILAKTTNETGGGVALMDGNTSDEFQVGVGAFANRLCLRSNEELFKFPTADGTSGQAIVTDGSGNLSFDSVSGGLTIGTTPISSGSVGGVLFEGTGNVVQQDASFFWDNTNKRLGVGATPATNVRLDVRAQGALSTDIAFRVRNSANSVNLHELRGDGSWFKRNNTGSSYLYYDGASTYEFATPSQLFLQTNTSTPSFSITHNGTSAGTYLALRTQSQALFIYRNGNFYFGASPQSGNGTNAFILENGTPPTTNQADRYYQYSADIVAGNAAPHFRTENGAVVKIYQQTTAVTPATVVSGSGGNVKHDDTFDGYTVEQVVKALRNTGLLQ